MVLDASLFNSQRYKVRNKGKVERPPPHLGVVAIEKEAFRSLSTKVANFTYFIKLCAKGLAQARLKMLSWKYV